MPASTRLSLARTGTLIIASACLVILLVYCVGGKQVVEKILRMKLKLFFLAVGLQVAHMLLWSLRWSLIIHAQGQRAPKEIVAATFSGAFFNNVTPMAKSGGEPVRAYLLSKMNDTSFEEGMASVVVDRIFDMAPFIIVCLVTFALITTSRLASNVVLRTLVLLGLLASAALSAVVAFASLRKDAGLRTVLFFFDKLEPIIKRFGPVEQLRNRLKEALERFYVSVKSISENKGLLLASTLISLLLWLIIILRLKVVFLALGSDQSLFIVNVVSVGAVFVEFLPLLPGGLVSTEATMIGLFIGLGIRKDLSSSAVLLDRLISYWLVTLAGGITTLYFGVKYGFGQRSNRS